MSRPLYIYHMVCLKTHTDMHTHAYKKLPLSLNNAHNKAYRKLTRLVQKPCILIPTRNNYATLKT